jgi:hypothetical protein
LVLVAFSWAPSARGRDLYLAFKKATVSDHGRGSGYLLKMTQERFVIQDFKRPFSGGSI